MNMPGFTADASAYRTSTSYRAVYRAYGGNGAVAVIPGLLSPEYYVTPHNSVAKFHVLSQLRFSDPTAIYGNCCGYSRKCNCNSVTDGTAVDRACRDHDVCVDSLATFTRCECHTDFVEKLESAVADPSTTAGARAAALTIIAAYATIPCSCGVKIPWAGTLRYPSTVSGCRVTPGHISAGVSCPSDAACVNPTSCRNDYECCRDYYCIENRCRHCCTGFCGLPFADAPCCHGYYWTGERCQPVGTHPL